MSNANTRAHYRIPYPVALRPQLSCNLGRFAVIDIAEQGLKFETPRENPFKKDSPFRGKAAFHDGESHEVMGKVLRTEGVFVILELSEGIPLKKIMAEQRFLLQHFPDSLSKKTTAP